MSQLDRGKPNRVMYMENKSRGGDSGPARIGRVEFSKSGRSIRYKGKYFQRMKGGGTHGGNYFDVETGEEYWISGVKKNRGDRHWAGAGPVEVDEDAREEYEREIGRPDDRRVREARSGDVDRLAEIWHRGWLDGHADILPAELARRRTRARFAERLRAALDMVRVVEAPGGLAGFCMTRDDEIHQLYLSRESRGTGAAALLEADAVSIIAGRGARVAWLACAIGNERAARFYEKSGWRRVGTMVSQLETEEGIFPLEVWRYEKRLVD